MSNHVTITGRLGADPAIKFTPQGRAVAEISIADTPRRKNTQTGEWEDAGETLWLRTSLWGAAAEQLAEQARKGDQVTAVGRLRQRSWETKEGDKRVVIELDAQSVAIVPKPRQTERQPQATGDPWARGGDPSLGAGGWAQATTDEPPFAVIPATSGEWTGAIA